MLLKIGRKSKVFPFLKKNLMRLRANEALRKYLPAPLRDLDQKLITDDVVKKWHGQLLQSLGLLESE